MDGYSFQYLHKQKHCLFEQKFEKRLNNFYNRFNFRVGRRVEDSLQDVNLTMAAAPSTIIFPASHGLGLTFTLLIQFLLDHHNKILNAFSELKKVRLTTVGCPEIIDG